MISTSVQTLILTAIAVLPGALYTWAFEQQAGRWGATAVDRAQKFIGASAVFLVIELPFLIEIVVPRLPEPLDLQHDPELLPLWFWIVPATFVALPILIGHLLGQQVHRRKEWTQWITGPSPAPRAWDYVFARPDVTGWIRLRLPDGQWVGGLWGRSDNTNLESYASGYPETQDLLISELSELDEDGEFIVGEDGRPVLTGRSLLVSWSDVAYAEFIPG